MRKMIRVGAIDFINCLPFFTAFNLKQQQLHGTFTYAVPSALNRALRNHELDLSLISSAEYLAHQDLYTIVTDYCIGADGPVMSVLLYTKYPIQELSNKSIALTAQSASSALLLKILCHHFWHIKPHFTTADTTTTAMQYDAFLLIGDDCLANQEVPGYTTIDLAQTWRDYTRLPFTFAVFATHRTSIDSIQEEIAIFNDQLKQSLEWAEKNKTIIEQQATKRCPLPIATIRHYYNLLKYNFNDRQRLGLQAFQELAHAIK